MDTHLFIRLSVNAHLDCFYFLPIMNNAAMNIHLQLFVRTHVFNSSGHKPRSMIARSNGNSMFNHLRNGCVPYHFLPFLYV